MLTQTHSRIRDIVDSLPLADTHEHLYEESTRLGQGVAGVGPSDWAGMLVDYSCCDLSCAGMPAGDRLRLFDPSTPTLAKYELLAPYWERVRHSGYAQAVRHTLRDLYGEDDLTRDAAPRIAEKFTDLVKPGFYREILTRRARVEACHVNSFESAVCIRSAQPDLLKQDLSINALACRVDRRTIEQEFGRTATTLEGWLEIIDWAFATYAPHAVAVKANAAYARRLDFAPVSPARAAATFRHMVTDYPVGPEDSKALQDFLVRYCIERATEHGLPVKFHTGYMTENDFMNLGNAKRNAEDLCQLLRDFPATKFIAFHIGYPYQHEMLALAKHYSNLYIDMCWAWIVNPVASVRFLKEMVTSVPVSKLLVFGGDYRMVEPVYGHARMARQGIALALAQLVEEGWLAAEEVPALLERVMYGNARELFPAR